jgi:hypothetical protein
MTSSLARGAMLLLFDVAPEALAEHDDWHTHEHMPERLAIPGFLRGTRWKRETAGPQYCVVYDVEDLAVLDSTPYRQRLDHPTPWTLRMMSRYVGMRRTLCKVTAQDGCGLGNACLVVTFTSPEGLAAEVRRRLTAEVLADLPRRRGLVGYRLLENALLAPMSREQAIRGRDGAVQSALLVTGYAAGAVASLMTRELAPERMTDFGIREIETVVFRLAYALASGVA